MRNNIFSQLFIIVLSIVFSIALMFAFIELPGWIDSLITQKIGFPGFDQGASETNEELSNLYIDALYLRWIGYCSLGLVVLFIAAGFITRKSSLAWAGAFALFLPVFGQFALSMFFLSGLGILRVGWIPFLDISWDILDLGKAIYIPYWIFMWFFNLFGLYAHDFIAWMFMAIGSLMFVWGVMEWIRARFSSGGVAIRSIYKISRHPQYLGWILWSYGLMLFSQDINNMKKSWGMASSLPWLLMTMVIIGICLMEESRMQQQYGDKYDNYRTKTPFMLPLPSWLKKLVRIPARLVPGKKSTAKTPGIIKITALYTIIIMLISTIWIDFRTDIKTTTHAAGWNTHQEDSIQSQLNREGQSRKDYYKHIKYIRRYGPAAIPTFMKLLDHPAAEVREFSVHALGDYKATQAVPMITPMIFDSISRVRSASIEALGNIGDPSCKDALIEALLNPEFDGFRFRLYYALSGLGVQEVKPLLIEGMKKPPWYQQTAAMRSMYQLDPDSSLLYIGNMVHDTDHRVRREAVFLLLKNPSIVSYQALKTVSEDEDFETRFYARQGLKKIKELSPKEEKLSKGPI